MINLSNLETEAKTRGLSDLTLKAYLRHNGEFLKFIKKNPEEILQEDIKNYMSYLLNEKKLKPASLSIALCALKFYYKEILNKNMFNEISIQKAEKTEAEALTKEEIKKLLGNISNPKHRLLVSFLYGSGLRVSEAVKLKIKDLNLKEGMGKVMLGEKEKGFVVPSNLAIELQDFIENRNKESEFLFPTRLGHVSVRMAQKIVNKAAKKAKLDKKIHCHLLRASYASHLCDEGYSLGLIKTLLGTKRRLSKEQLKKIISPFEKISL